MRINQLSAVVELGSDPNIQGPVLFLCRRETDRGRFAWRLQLKAQDGYTCAPIYADAVPDVDDLTQIRICQQRRWESDGTTSRSVLHEAPFLCVDDEPLRNLQGEIHGDSRLVDIGEIRALTNAVREGQGPIKPKPPRPPGGGGDGATLTLLPRMLLWGFGGFLLVRAFKRAR